FQMFSKVSGEKLIPLNDELKICRAHLAIMEYRKGAKYKFVTKGINGDEKIPPGIFHTLAENGTTHGYTKEKKGLFCLSKEITDGITRYVFFNDSEINEITNTIEKGTGLKYIESRLEETFPGLWNMKYDYADNGWKVIIEIYETEGRVE
ncbi:transcriptional regulator, partial [Bacteroidota bacterium]